MKPKPNKRIDKLHGELGLHPHSSKVARYRRERTPKGCERTAQVPTSRPFLASSFLLPLSCGLRRGRATCAVRAAWHLTSAKNLGSSQSSATTPNPHPPMKPESQLPQLTAESACGLPPLTVPSASCSESAHATFPSRRMPASNSDDDEFHFGLELKHMEQSYSESDGDFDDDSSERELLMDDLASDNDDFSRSNDDGWFYSDED